MSILIIDAENIRIRESELLYFMILYNIDEIFIYFDMEKNNISQNYIDWCFKYNCFLIHVPSFGHKNSVDLQISIDVTEWCIKNTINTSTILIASNDRDFIPLCNFLISYNKSIVLIVYEKINDYLSSIIHKFHFIKSIDIDLLLILYCFIIQNSNHLSFPLLKKLLKKLNKKKKMKNFSNIEDLITNQWNNIFHYSAKNIILLSSIF